MQISPAKKQKLKANLGKTSSGKASFEDLHPRYPAGHPQGGKFMPKGGNDYVKAVAKNSGRTPQEVKASLGGDVAKTKTTTKTQTPQKGSLVDIKALPPEAAKELQANTGSLNAALQARQEAEQKKLNAVKGTKREAGKAFTAAKKEVSAKQKAVEAVLIKHGASKQRAKEIAEKLIAQKVGQAKDGDKPIEKSLAEKVKAKPVEVKAPPVVKAEPKNNPKSDTAKSKPSKKIDFSQGKSFGAEMNEDGSDIASNPKKKTFKNLDKAADKISEATGMSKEESRKSAHAIAAFSMSDYMLTRSHEKAGKEFRASDGGSDYAFDKANDYDRVKAINNFLDKAPKYEGTVHRGLMFSDKKTLDKFLKSIQTGEVLDSMSSTTSNPEIAKGFATEKSTHFGVVMNIKNKSGVAIKTLSRYPEEDEVLVPRGTLYKASKVTKSIGENGKEFYTIDVDEIDHENQQTRRDSKKKK